MPNPSLGYPAGGSAALTPLPATPQGPLGSISACCLCDFALSQLAGVRACGAPVQVPPSPLCCRKSSARFLLLRAHSRPGAAGRGVGPTGLCLAPWAVTCSASMVQVTLRMPLRALGGMRKGYTCPRGEFGNGFVTGVSAVLRLKAQIPS